MKYIRLDVYTNGTATTYREDKIVSLSTHRQLFDGSPSVGNCICGELNATVTIPNADISRNAKLVPYISDDETNWTKKSEFFVFSREVDKVTGYVTLTAYDAIYKTSNYFSSPGNIGTWPKTDLTVMDMILNGTGATMNSATRTAMNKAYVVQYPGIILEDNTPKPDGQGALTMRDVAGRIASFYGGNWIIDNNGQWRLILLGDIPSETDYLVTENSEIIVMGGVMILVR